MFDFFVNDKYRVLECRATRQISVHEELVVKLSQQEVADILGISKPKVNAIIKELKDAGYIEQESTRGKYLLTPKAVKELNSMRGTVAKA